MMALVMGSGWFALTRMPVLLLIITSGMPPMLQLITGSPSAPASINVTPSASREPSGAMMALCTSISLLSICCVTSLNGMLPVRVKQSSTPYCFIACWHCGISGPSPATVQWKFVFFSFSVCAISGSLWIDLHSISRPTVKSFSGGVFVLLTLLTAKLLEGAFLLCRT